MRAISTKGKRARSRAALQGAAAIQLVKWCSRFSIGQAKALERSSMESNGGNVPRASRFS